MLVTNAGVARSLGVVTLAVAGVQLVAVMLVALCVMDAQAPSVATTSWLSIAGQLLLGATPVGVVALLLLFAHHGLAVEAEAALRWQRVFGVQQAWAMTAIIAYAALAYAALHTRAESTSLIALLCVLGVAASMLALRAALHALAVLPLAVRKQALMFAASACSITVGMIAISAQVVSTLQHATLWLVSRAVELAFDDITSDPTIQAIGTTRFRVRIEPSCSGVDGIVLAAALVAAYLSLSRKQLVFPRALWLGPIVVCSVALMNALRIVALIAYGQSHSAAAVDAFHSSIGWFFFVATVAAVIPFAERVLQLSPATSTRTTTNPALPYLAPLLASIACALVISMLDLAGTRLVLLRYAAALLALGLLHAQLPSLRAPASSALLVGAGVALGWIASNAASAAAHDVAVAHTPIADPFTPFGVLHVLGYCLLTPLVEELAFRGYLMRRLMRADFTQVAFRDVSLPAIVGSSLAFGALHARWVEATLAGIAFGLLAKRSTGTGPAFIAHASANALICSYALATGRIDLIG